MWCPPLKKSYNSTTSSDQSYSLNGGVQTNGTNYIPVTTFANLVLYPPKPKPISSIEQHETLQHLDSNTMFVNSVLHGPEFKVLHRMVEGYNNFLSLRRASYTFIDDIPRFSEGDPEVCHEAPKKLLI